MREIRGLGESESEQEMGTPRLNPLLNRPQVVSALQKARRGCSHQVSALKRWQHWSPYKGNELPVGFRDSLNIQTAANPTGPSIIKKAGGVHTKE